MRYGIKKFKPQGVPNVLRVHVVSRQQTTNNKQNGFGTGIHRTGSIHLGGLCFRGVTEACVIGARRL